MYLFSQALKTLVIHTIYLAVHLDKKNKLYKIL